MANVIGLEVGTTTAKALAIVNGKVVAIASSDGYEPEHPFPGASRQDPSIWWAMSKQVILRVCRQAEILPADVDCLVVSGQMHGLVPNGAGKASLWNDTTATKGVDVINNKAKRRRLNVLMHTGNIMGPNMTAAKIADMGAREMKFFTLPAGSVTRRLIGESVIDPSDASGTLLWDIRKRCWSQKMLHLVGLSPEQLPRLVGSLEVAGHVTHEASQETGLRKGTAVLAGGADQSESALGMGLLPENKGVMGFEMGTSGVIKAALFVPMPDEQLNTFAHVIGVITFLCTCACGDAQSFIKNMLKLSGYASMDELAADSPIGSRGVTFVPLLAGSRMLGNFDPNGSFLHMSTSTSNADICRAVQEGIIMEALMGLRVIQSKGISVRRVILGGGGAKSKHLCQMVADIFGAEIVVPRISETTVLGAAIRGAVVMGDYPSVDAACEVLVKPACTYKPDKKRHNEYTTRVFPRFLRDVEKVTGCKVR